MQTIFIMVKCELGKTYDVADELVQSVEQVSEVHSISGQYDLLVKCYLPQEMDIGHFVASQIQRVRGHQGHLHDHHVQGVYVREREGRGPVALASRPTAMISH